MNKRIKKGISIVLIAGLLVLQNPVILGSATAYAQSMPEQPAQPSQPEQPSQPSQPNQPSQPSNPTGNDTGNSSSEEENSASQGPSESGTEAESENEPQNTASTSEGNPPTTVSSGYENEHDNIGDTTIETGDANAVGVIDTEGNLNVTVAAAGSSAGGAVIQNSGNMSGSQNGASIVDTTTNTTNQQNSVVLTNSANLASNSGDNSIKDNAGGDVTIATGDANTALTVVNNVNTNVAGSDIVEFNVIEDHVGDIVLDFSNPCATGCVSGNPLYMANKENGSDSTNTLNSTSTTTNDTFQSNDAVIENNLILSSNTGENTIKDNTGGDATLTTGDANVAANVVNFANNNLAGNVIIGFVNIFGDLDGDIILPEDQFLSDGGNAPYLANVGNGSDSENFVNYDQATADTINQTNAADINNNIGMKATTGFNDVKDTTNGNVDVQTGDVDVVAQIINIANTNVVGGNWWLVFVNEAGNWIGKIVGGDSGMNYAGSEGSEFNVAPDGTIAVNMGNGSDSNNQVNSSTTNTNTTTQTNNAIINNNLTLDGNTGKNSVKDNAGSSTNIATGDVNLFASVINFVNNNYVGTGKLIVTFVNVLGSWKGNFIAPGQEKEVPQNTNTAVGGYSFEEEEMVEIVESDTATDSQSTSKTKVKKVASVNRAIAGGSVNSRGNILGYSNLGSDEPEEVVSEMIEETTVSGKKVRKINLAWGIFALPFIGGFVIARRFKKKIV